MFNVRDYWEKRYASGGNSGAGSYGNEAIYKGNVISEVMSALKLKSVTDIGCGDGNNLQYYDITSDYCGYDISETAVRLCKEKYPQLFFTTDKNEVQLDSDLCLCIDVLFHQVEDSLYKETLDLMFTNQFKFIVLYCTNHNDNQGMSIHMKNRKVTDDIKQYTNYQLLDIAGNPYTDKYFIIYEKK